MTNREYFEQALLLDQRINSYQQELDQLRTMATSISSPIYGGGRVQTSSAHEAPFVKYVDQFIAFETKINAEIDALYALKTEMEDVISALPSKEEQIVLRYRYLCGKTWKEIGARLNVDPRTAQRWNEMALAHAVQPNSKNLSIL